VRTGYNQIISKRTIRRPGRAHDALDTTTPSYDEVEIASWNIAISTAFTFSPCCFTRTERCINLL
jgi:hypothetical protein